MRRSTIFTAVLVSLLLTSMSAHAAELFVSTTGHDANPGTLAAPFRTIHAAAKAVKPGDVVNVRGGTYGERIGIYSKGTAAARIAFRPFAGETVVLDGSTIGAGTPVVSINGAEYVDFSGFEVRNSSYIGIVLWHARNVRVLDNHVHHTTRNGIYVGGDVAAACADITISGNQVHDTVLENQYHTMGSGGWAGAVVVSRTERATISGNKIWNNDGEGLISLRSNYAVIQNNEIFDNYSVNLYLDNARFVTADRNLIYSTGNTRYYRDGRPGAGIGVANETKDVMNPSSDNVFTNNIVVGTRWGFYYGNYESGGGLRNTKVLHNTFYGTTEEIIRIENDTHSNSAVANNIFYQTGSAAPKYSGAGAVTYQRNLWYGGSAGVAAGTADLFGDPLFANAGGRTAADYKLLPLSPAVHTAIDFPDVANDHFGQRRTPSSDIGAHEESISLGSSAPVRPAILAPTDVTARLDETGTVRVTWTASRGAVKYDVYRNGHYFTSVESARFKDLTVLPANLYTYEISARDAGGSESARSAMASITTPAAASSLDAPAGFAAVASSSRVDLSWRMVTGASSYAVYRDGAKVTDVASASFTDVDVKSSTTYSYHVIAIASDGTTSAASDTIRVTTSGAGRRRAVR